jgi:eukaryotic-like serine/threonine-protein kinase
MIKAEPQYAIQDRFLDQPYTLAGRLIDPVSGMLSWQGKCEHLRRKELEVLALLASAEGKQVSRDNFIAVVWQGNDLVGDRGLSNTIVFVRKSLRDDDAAHPVIRTIPRRGYQLCVPVQQPPEALETQALVNVEAVFVPGGMIPECPGWRLVKRLSQSASGSQPDFDNWLAEPSEFGERDQGLRVFRFCRSELHLQRLRREVTLLRYLRDALVDNQHFALIQDWQLDEPPYYLARDYTAFGTLSQWRSLADAPVAQRRAMMQGLSDAVAAMHALGVVHRQLSVETILVDTGESGLRLKVSAFDLAALHDRSALAPLKITAAGLTVGAGELGAELTAADDVPALGTVLLQLVLGDLQAQPGAECLSKVGNPPLQAILSRCFGPAPARPSASELAAQLRGLFTPETAPVAAIASTEAVKTPAAIPKPLSTPLPLGVPTTIGNYHLLDHLGEGGMGTVYLAEQRAPVYRKVALKIIRSGLDGKQILSRFDAERQALAMMNHPNVAAVHESGMADDGRPFFAMEYIAGDDITSYCDAHHLNLSARIKLFLQVCDGVLHAHQKGVLHRDIKPSNLMVSGAPDSAGTVKVIDFGLAKSLQGKLAAHTLHTSFGAFIGTPVYSSPEHISGSAGGVDTRSDVYSMGVVLYELLVGMTPIASESLENLEPEKVREIVSKSKLPSMREQLQNASVEKRATLAEYRSVNIDELPKSLEGDLSWVVGRCLERDPNDRYASVLELKKDLERWLEFRPVEARPTTGWYRFRKLVRRNRGVSMLIAASVSALVVTTAAAVVGYFQAERAFASEKMASAEAKASLDFQVKQIESLDEQAMGIDLRKVLMQKFSAYTKSLNLEPLDAETTKTRLTGAIKSVQFTDLVINQLETHYFRPGIKRISTDYQNTPALQEVLWKTTMSNLVDVGLNALATELGNKIFAQRLSRLGPDHLLTLESRIDLAQMLSVNGASTDSKAMLKDSVARILKLNGAHTKQTLRVLRILGSFAYNSGDWDQATAYYREALSAAESLFGKDDFLTLELQVALGSHYLIDRQEFTEAEPLIEMGYSKLLASHGARKSLKIQATVLLAGLREEQGKMAEAIDLGSRALAEMIELEGTRTIRSIVAMNNQAVRLNKVGHFTEALALLRKAETLKDYMDELSYGNVTGNLGKTLLSLGRLTEAKRRLTFAVDQFTRTASPTHPSTLKFVLQLGHLAMAQGQWAEASAHYQRFLDGSLQASDTTSNRLISARAGLGLTLLARGKIDEARKMLEIAVADSLKLTANQPATTLRIQSYYALTLPTGAPEPTAFSLLSEVVRKQETTLGVEPADRIEPLANLAKLFNDLAQPQEALKHTDVALEIGKKIYPEGHYLIATVLIQQGRALIALGRAVEAKVAFAQAQAMITNTEGLDLRYQRELDEVTLAN